MTTAHHIVSISGGKDSTAVYLLAVEWSQRHGKPFRAVFADTGNEHPATYDYVRQLPQRAGGPEIEWVKADFSQDIERKRRFIAQHWAADGVPAHQIIRALDLLIPTGNPFLDLCMLKGRFPSRKAQFCTEELKRNPIHDFVVEPILGAGEWVWSWQGVRREEGKTHDHPRRLLPRTEHVGDGYWITRPILEWKVADVFAAHKRHGVAPNPLYRQGMGRVGCMPCINCAKGELAEIAVRFPAQVERIAEWEELVSDVSKRGCATFFPAVDLVDFRPGQTVNHRTHGIRSQVDWSKTTRGGRQFDLLRFNTDTTACRSNYGLCE